MNTDEIMNELQGSVFFPTKQEKKFSEVIVNKSTSQLVNISYTTF